MIICFMRRIICANFRSAFFLCSVIALHAPVMSQYSTVASNPTTVGDLVPNKALLASSILSVPRKPVDATVQTFRVPLSQLLGQIKTITLKGLTAEVALPLSLPSLFDPVEVVLNLSGSASRSLIESSQLVVKANGRVVDQVGLRDNDSNFQRSIIIPGIALKEGLNDIRLVAAQRSHPAQSICDADVAQELWTEIDLLKSGFVINGRLNDIPARLDAMGVLFDKSTLEARPLIPFFTAGRPAAAEIKALGIAAQGLGRRYDDVPVSIVYKTLPEDPNKLAALLPNGTRGAIVMGTFTNIAPYLTGLGLPEKAGPVIAVHPLPGDSSRFMLIIAAENASELAEAAKAFSLPGLPWPDQPWMQVSRVEMPDTYEEQRVIAAPAAPSGIFPLRALQYRTATSTGRHAAETKLKFWSNNWQGRLLVQVHLSYTSGMSTQSALNVLTNGVMHGSIPLNNPVGGSYFSYAVNIPSGSMKSGWNTLQFQPVLIPEGAGQGCRHQADESLAVTLYDDTTLQKYEGVASKQPDLALLSGTGHSYIDSKTSTQTAVHLADADSQTISAGLTLLAKISQVQQGPVQPVWFGVGESPSVQNHIWIGTEVHLPANVRRSASTNKPQEVTVHLPLVESSLVSRPDGAGWLTSLKDKLGYKDEKEPTYARASLNIASPRGNKSYAYTRRVNGITTTVFTADDSNSLASGIVSITEPQKWNKLRGYFSSWTPGTNVISAGSAEEAPFQAYGLRGGLGMFVSRYPWMALLAMGVAIALLVPLTARVLRSYRKRNHGPNEQ